MDRERIDTGSQQPEFPERSPVSQLVSLAWEIAPLFAQERGIDFSSLPSEKKSDIVLELLRQSFSQIRKETSPSFSSEKLPSLRSLEVNPHPVSLRLIFPKKEPRVVILGTKRKEMLALFAGLTEEKVTRFQNPWINRKELLSYSPYSLEQLYRHFFEFFADLGVLEVSKKYGYRLVCDPSQVLRILSTEGSHFSLNIVGCENWLKEKKLPILIDGYLFPLIASLAEQIHQSSDNEDFLNVSRLEDETGLSRHQVYMNLSTLESLGIIRREDRPDRYRLNDTNQPLVEELIRRWKTPINIRLKNHSPSWGQRIETRRAFPLEVKGQEIIDFPSISWKQKMVETNCPFSHRHDFLSLLNQALTLEWSRTFVLSKDQQTVYLGLLPSPPLVKLKEVLGILDYLGVGPEEAKTLANLGEDSLLAAIHKMEQSSLLPQKIFADEIKARIAGAIFEEVFPAEEGSTFAFAELTGLLETAIKETLWQETTSTNKILFETPKETKPSLNPKLLLIMEGPLKKELSLLFFQDPPATNSLMFASACRYHHLLAERTSLIPWEDLIALGLVSPQNKDNYLITPPGALIAVLFLNFSLHNRVLLMEKRSDKALRTLALHASHLLREVLRTGQRREKEKRYLSRCLQILEKKGLVCPCEACQR